MTANLLRVTMVQADLAWQDPAANRHALAARFRGLQGHTDLIVLPEMFSTGFSMDAAKLAETMDGPTVGWLREEAAAMGCAITGSLIVRDEQGRHFNRLLWASPYGELYQYDKRHLFRMAREHEHYASGDRRLVVELKGWRICPMVCYDLRFPVWSRNRGDYDVLVYVANWPARRRAAWTALLRARAIENLAYVLAPAQVGHHGGGRTSHGQALIADPWGAVVAQVPDGEGVALAELDFARLARLRRELPALGHVRLPLP